MAKQVEGNVLLQWWRKFVLVLAGVQIALILVAETIEALDTSERALLGIAIVLGSYVIYRRRHPRRVVARNTSTGERKPLMPRTGS